MGFYHRKECRICKSTNLEKFLSLGNHPPVDNFIERSMIEKEKKYPLEVYFCNSCKLVQLLDVVQPEELFHSRYAFFSSASPPLVNHFKEYAEDVKKTFLNKGELVVEIGSNDGALLQFFMDDYRVLGIEPSKNVADAASAKGIETISEFFTENLAKQISEKYGKAKVIIANNVFAHIDDISEVVRGIKALLKEDGVYVFEAHYLLDLLEKREFDTIYHEHLCYFSLKPLIEFFKRFGMEVFDVKRVDVHGGSIRVFVRFASGKPMSNGVKELLELEEKSELYKLETFLGFQKEVEGIRDELVNIVKGFREQGKVVVGYGAPAKSGTLLNFCGFGEKDLKYITDTTQHKIGLLTPGSHIPVVSPEILKTETPDYILLLAWNYKDFILSKEADLRKRGAKFIIPVPKVEIV